MPHERAYIRNGVGGLSVEEQEAALRDSGRGALEPYRDHLSKLAVRQQKTELLKERASLLRPTTSKTGGVIVVASLPVLAFNLIDLVNVLAAIEKRHDAVLALDTGKSYGPEWNGEVYAEAALDFRRSQTAKSRHAGVEAARLAREKRRAGRLAKAREMWVLPEGDISAEEIGKKVGLTARTLYTYLGTREAFRAALLKKDKKR